MTRGIMQFMQPDKRRMSIVSPRSLSRTLFAMALSVLTMGCQEIDKLPLATLRAGNAQ